MNAPSRVLILGAGQIGMSVAEKLTAVYPGVSLTLHGRSSDPADRLGGYSDALRSAVVATVVADLAAFPADNGAANPEQILSHSRKAVLQIVGSQTFDLVVDATNMATSLADDHRLLVDGHIQSSLGLAAQCLAGCLVGMEEALHTGAVRQLVCVSTTGLGGMGLRMPFSHGDSAIQGERIELSERLWAKMFLSGGKHQILWAMSRSYPGRVHLVVPAAAVGFEPLASGVSMSRAGEGRAYNSDEMLLMTHPAMMGLISREDTASAVLEILSENLRQDCLAALEEASMKPATNASSVREERWDALNLSAPASAQEPTGNLGPRVSALMIEFNSILGERGHKVLGEYILEFPGRSTVKNSDRSVFPHTDAEVDRQTWWARQLEILAMDDAVPGISFDCRLDELRPGDVIAEVLSRHGYGRVRSEEFPAG